MSIFRIPVHIFILYLFYSFGSWIQTIFHLFIPGSVIGMMLFLIALLLGFNPKWVGEGTAFLIRHLPLLFLPATVGAISYLHLFSGWGITLIFIALFSTILVMVSSGIVSQQLGMYKDKHYE